MCTLDASCRLLWLTSWCCGSQRSDGVLLGVAKNGQAHGYNHPELDRIWVISTIFQGSFKDHILSTPGWLQTIVVINAPLIPKPPRM